MDERTLSILDCNKIKNTVAGFAVSEAAKKQIKDLAMLDSAEKIIREQNFIGEQIELMNKDLDLPLEKLSSIGELLIKIQPADWMLTAPELILIGRFLETVRLCKGFILAQKKDIPLHCEDFSDLKPLPEIEKMINRTIDEKGEISDNASDELSRMRRQIRHSETKLIEKIQKILSSYNDKNVLQDNYYTQRNGRYVLPIRASQKNKIHGIIHDASSSGETCFIEPAEIIAPANELQNLYMSEKEEIRKILLDLTKSVRGEREVLRYNEKLMTRLDFIHAKARFASRFRMNLPVISERDSLKLLNSHHPLIFINKRESSVPIDFRTRPHDKTIIITGPNTGGKTTALKNVGLSSWMALCGLPISSSPESVIPIYNEIFADIGDEQDVSEGVSAFSGHIRNLKRILESLSSRSLILLDEIGTATDPQEGGAIACALLENMSEKARLIIATSHLPALKHWAHSYPSARNASFYLDEATRAPAFKLVMDVPGLSEAFTIALREGIPEKIIKRAKGMLTKEEKDLTNLLLSLQEKEKELTFLRHNATAIKEANEALKVRYENLLTELNAKQMSVKREALEEKEKLLRTFKREIESKIASLPSRKDLSKIREEIIVEEKKIFAEKKHVEKEIKTDDYEEIDESISPGDKVFISFMSDVGILKKIDFEKNKAVVFFKNKEMNVPANSLMYPHEEDLKLDVARIEDIPPVTVAVKKKSDVPIEINLHGMRVDPALAMIDKLLNDATMNNYPYVKLCHGHGTGILRKAIHEYLKTHPLAKKFRFAQSDEGGSGVTVVELK